MQESMSAEEDSSIPPQIIGALPNIVPTAKFRADGNCPNEGVELVLSKSTTSVILLGVPVPSTMPLAIKYLSAVQ